MKWMFNSFAYASVAGDATVRRFFANSSDEQLLVIKRKGDSIEVPRDRGALVVRSFTNYAALKRAFEEHALDGVDAILYDNEAWRFTPQEEQRDPERYTKRVADLVHAHGLRFISAPAANLAKVLAPGVEKRYDGYLGLKIAALSARYADIYEIQAQGSEGDVRQFTDFVREAARQAHEMNPRVVVLAGISTNPSGQKMTADRIVEVIRATRAFVGGYWFNIPRPSAYCPRCNEYRPDMAIEVFRRLLEDGVK
jgi:hypothetical protein